MSERTTRHAQMLAEMTALVALQLHTNRLARGWSIQELATKSGVRPENIAAMERGVLSDHSAIAWLKKLASAMDIALIARFEPYSRYTAASFSQEERDDA